LTAIRVAVTFTVASIVFACSGQWPAQVDMQRYSPAQFYATTSFEGASFSADETRILFSSDASGVFNVYAQPISGGAPAQLTHSTTESTFAVAFFPSDDRFLFTRDQGGNELNHLFVQDRPGASSI
jgi:WD40-like Beta Propeller Repeat